MGRNKKKNQFKGFGQPPQPKKQKAEPPSLVFPDWDDEEEEIELTPEQQRYLDEMKARNLTLEEFKQEFSGELDTIEITEGYIRSYEGDRVVEYEGKTLAVRQRGYSGPADLIPFPNADDPTSPVPPEVYDTILWYWW